MPGSILEAEELEVAGEAREHAEVARLVARWQAGETRVFASIYTRYFDRVYTYLNIVLGSEQDAQDGAQEVFTRVVAALPRYEIGEAPFESWLFRIARNYSLNHLRKHGRVTVEDGEEIERRREGEGEVPAVDVKVLRRLSDQDLLVFIRRMPLAQQQVIVLRYMMDLSLAEIAETLGRTHQSVRHLHMRACEFLRKRMVSLGREPARAEKRPPMRQLFRHNKVVRERRHVLNGGGGAWR